jgi:hypothetical protein
MIMSAPFRRLGLTAHLAFSIGWFGAVVAYLVLAVAALTGEDAQRMHGNYLALELIGWFVIVPFSLATLLTGIIQSVGTEWGLFRYHWVQTKFLLIIGATVVLLAHMPTVGRIARASVDTTLSSTDHGVLPIQLVVHAAGGVLVLLAATVLSVFKPWGMTSYGRRKVGL